MREIQIRLLRHPQKVFGTGELTPEGIEDFSRLVLAAATPDTNLVQVYLTPHSKRGRTLLEPANRIHISTPGVGPPLVCHELGGRFDEFTPADTQAIYREIMGEDPKNAELHGSGLYEPQNAQEEARICTAMIHKFWDIPFPGPSGLSGRDVALEVQRFIDAIISNMHHLPTDYKVTIIAISHSGIIEHFIKLVYLQNKPQSKPQEVSVRAIGGLVDFLTGPRIIIQKHRFEEPTVRFMHKRLLMPYRPAGPGIMTLD